MIKGELLNKLRKLPASYDNYFVTLSRAVDRDDTSLIELPELPEGLTPDTLGQEIENGTADFNKLGDTLESDLRELATPMKIGFAYMKVNHDAEWPCFFKRGIPSYTEAQLKNGK